MQIGQPRQQDYKLIAIEEAKYAEDVCPQLDTHLEQAVCPFDIFQIGGRNTIYLFNDVQYLDDFVLHLSFLLGKKILKVVLVCYDLTNLHVAKVMNK